MRTTVVPPVPSRMIAGAAGMLALTLLLAACAAGGASSAAPAGSAGSAVPPGATGSAADAARASAVPVTASDPNAVAHPTGARDIVLRIGQTGGFMAPGAVMARVPSFTLYGDGRVLVAPAGAAPAGGGLNPGAGGGLNPGAGGPAAGTPLRTARLSETDMQALLRFALTDGRLGVARPQYLGAVMDLPTTLFEIHAGGVDKTVRVTGLSDDPPAGPDQAELRALAALAARLAAVTGDEDYVPPAFVALLAEAQPDPAVVASPWPWSRLTPAAFAAPSDPAIPFATHVLTPAELAEAGQSVGPGGLSGLRYAGPDGRTYIAVIRPALPEELPAG